jgi:enoyl-CoA hydratase
VPDADHTTPTRLRLERRDHGVLMITLDNPGKLNATDAVMHAELARVFRDIDTDESVRAVVVTGAGTAFSAGGDLDWIAEQVGDYAQTMRVMREAGDIVRTMIDCDTPIVSAINGVAVGAGLAVALMADVSIIDENARLTDGHLRLGVAAGDHAVAIWPLLCGMAKAKYYLLTADFLDGREAERIGLVSRAVPADDVLPTAVDIAERLARGPRDATRLTKRALNHWLRQALPNFEASLAYEMLNFLGPDAGEGLAALQAKRRPQFGGEP